MMSRLGIFGGMFDPVHRGHMEATRYAKKKLQLDCVKLVPCNIPNHRMMAFSAGHHRLKMLRLMTEGEQGVEVDDIELQRPTISFSSDTVRAIKDQRISENIVFILGMDSFNSITDWFDWEGLFSMCNLFVLARSGASVSKDVSQAIGFSERLTNDVSKLFQSSSGKIFVADEFNFNLSSSGVRSKLKRNLNVGKSLDQKVFRYIQKEGLYQ